MSEHIFDPSGPYHPEKLSKKAHIGADSFFQLDLRTGVITRSEEFPEMRKPSYKIEVNFGPVIGNLWSSAQITNYSLSELIGRRVVGALNLGEKRLPTGFLSQFLVLGALEPDGTVRLLEPPEGVMPGSLIA